MSKEAMKQALEALKYPLNQSHENFNVDMAELLAHRAITALREALAEQPAQQPLDKMAENARELGLDYEPAQRTWVGLTEEEMIDLQDRCGISIHQSDFQTIEAKLKEKNNG